MKKTIAHLLAFCGVLLATLGWAQRSNMPYLKRDLDPMLGKKADTTLVGQQNRARQAEINVRLPFVTNPDGFTAQTAARVAYNGYTWERRVGSITPNLLTTLPGGAGFYYQCVVPNGVITLSMAGGAPSLTNNATALQRCINVQAQTGYRILVDQPGTYSFTAGVTKAESFTGLSLDGVEGVTFNYVALPDFVPFINIVGGSGALTRSVVRNIRFVGDSTSIAIEIAGQCGQRVTDCFFETNRIGIRFHNDRPGTFTEHCVAQNCDFYTTCQSAIQYKKTNGDFSFHGSGLEGRNLINTVNSVVIVDDGTLPYNCPLSAQIWINAVNTTIVQNDNTGNFKPTFFGDLTVESMVANPTVLLSSGNKPVFFTGQVIANGDHLKAGQFVTCESVMLKNNGTAITRGARYNTAYPLTKGCNRIDQVPVRGGTYLVSLHLVGDNYDYRYTLLIQNEGTGGAGFTTQLANPRTFNSAGWGAPALACDESGNLTVTNDSFPVSGVTAYLTYVQMGDWNYGNYPNKNF